MTKISKIEAILAIVAIICITVLEAINMLVFNIDGTILSLVIGAIVFLATREYYIMKFIKY